VRLLSLDLRDFRCYTVAQLAFGPALTVITGPNGAGKTNLLEGLYFGCTGRSCRTANEREVVRFGAPATRTLVRVLAEDGAHELAVGFTPGQPKRLRIDGASVERLIDAPVRPLVSVFSPDRLDLVKGPPALRRAHLDQVAAALWPARRHVRRGYGQALAQRNALIARIRAGRATRASIRSWDEQVARWGVELIGQRRHAVEAVGARAGRIAAELGLESPLAVRYRPRSAATMAEELLGELQDRVEADIERGFTGHGPHRDELSLLLGDRETRVYASQGQQRVALLSLLLAEREAIAERRLSAPVMLLDDVMSELDHERREALVERLRGWPGQAIITATEADQVPGAADETVVRLSVLEGSVREAVVA
jgi:DNA replication and repair protein RecF